MTRLELLSPAKNLECGMEAINHGADAVYIGAARHGARAAAGNSTEDIARLCRYAHLFGAKVYVTVNTIIFDDEMEETLQLVRDLQAAGADAVLIQDMGLLTRLREEGVTVPLHASTQTDNRSVGKVRWLAGLGLKRVVLARELSIDEIGEIHRAVPDVELEVFVHGALCVSYSGQCYASQHCFGRSANRGECAQFCRMPFTLKDADGHVLCSSRHLLSLKDMAQIDNLERLARAGAVSFKIEGRLKDADYVKNVTAAYSERLDAICRMHPDRYKRSSRGRCTYTFTPDIRKSFNRGFTTYFADGRQRGMACFDSPKAMGEAVGRVKEIRGKSFNVASTAAFSNGDGLCFIDAGGNLVGFRVNRAEGNRLFPLNMPDNLKPGTLLYRNLDHAFLTQLSKPSAERKIEVDMLLRVDMQRLTLVLRDESGEVAGASVPYEYQKAQKPQDENMRRQLAKLGGTVFLCRTLEVESALEQPFVQSSLLAELRRKAVSDAEGWMQKAGCRVENAGYGRQKARPMVQDAATVTQPLLEERKDSAFLYNASNAAAKEFYRAQGVEGACSFEESGRQHSGSVIMQCRYCIRAEMGFCTKDTRRNGRLPWREPLTLALADGRAFTLKFDCRKCEMEVLA